MEPILWGVVVFAVLCVFILAWWITGPYFTYEPVPREIVQGRKFMVVDHDGEILATATFATEKQARDFLEARNRKIDEKA